MAVVNKDKLPEALILGEMCDEKVWWVVHPDRVYRSIPVCNYVCCN